MDARVISRRVEVDKSIAPSAVCGEIYATELVEVPVSVPAEDIRWLDRETMHRCRRSTVDDANAHDAEVRAVIANGDGGTWPGCIARIEAELDQATRTATVVVYVENPPPASDRPRLELNTYCEVTLLGRRVEQAYYLPRTAVLPEQEVYVIDKLAAEPYTGREANPGEAGRLAQRKIKVARFAAEQAMILPGGGLQPGDRVVLEYLARPILGQQMIALDRHDRTTETSLSPKASAPKPSREEGR